MVYFRTLFFLIILSVAGKSASLPAGCAARDYLNRRLAYWQQRLELGDWKISLVMSRAGGLKPNTLGNIHWDADRRTAVIRVLDAPDYQMPCSGMLHDMEVTVVHEPVHLELAALPRSAASRREEEHAVNRITDALLALERQDAERDAR